MVTASLSTFTPTPLPPPPFPELTPLGDLLEVDTQAPTVPGGHRLREVAPADLQEELDQLCSSDQDPAEDEVTSEWRCLRVEQGGLP